MSYDQIVEQILGALSDSCQGWPMPADRARIADALLPTVRQIAADELRAAAGWLVADPDKGGAPFITDNNSVFFPEHIDGAYALTWAAESLRDRATDLTNRENRWATTCPR